MAQFSLAVLDYAIALFRALFVPSRGRHSVAARRRRSGRVRRYAPLPDPAFAQVSAPVASRRAPRPAPRLAPSATTIPAEEVALVRGYYRAFEHERDLARVQADALARLDQWTAKPRIGDLLAPVPAPRQSFEGQHRRAVAV